jgi:hypothetical protein
MHKFLDMLLHLVARPVRTNQYSLSLFCSQPIVCKTQSEASARTWVDAFLYRASAILPATKQMVLNVEYNVSPVSVPTASGSEVILVGFIDYTVVVTNDPTIARESRYIHLHWSHFLGKIEYFLNNPGISNLAQHIDSVLGLFVVEAKDRDVKLYDHIPQVLMQLYAAAKKLKCSSNLFSDSAVLMI